jgi:hypothetical protein
MIDRIAYIGLTAAAVTGVALMLAAAMAVAGPPHERHAAVLEMLDTDADGSVSRSEFINGGEAHFAAADADGDGRLTPEEAQAARKAKCEARAGRLFGRFDGDGDGVVTREEFSSARGAFFDGLDANGNGIIDEDERPQHRHKFGPRPDRTL